MRTSQKLICFSILLLTFILFCYSTFRIQTLNVTQQINWNMDLLKNENYPINNTYALVFFGRRAQTQILMRYLVKNLKLMEAC
jgi:hypothetical protein